MENGAYHHLFQSFLWTQTLAQYILKITGEIHVSNNNKKSQVQSCLLVKLVKYRQRYASLNFSVTEIHEWSL